MSGGFHYRSLLKLSSGEQVTLNQITSNLIKNIPVYVQGNMDGFECDVEIEKIVCTEYIEQTFYKIGDCLLTKNHPIFYNMSWHHPHTIAYDTIKSDNGYLFNVILKKVDGIRGQSIYVNDQLCVCLGHGIENDPVASDPFWGSETIVNKLESRYGNKPYIKTNFMCIRSSETGFTTNVEFI